MKQLYTILLLAVINVLHQSQKEPDPVKDLELILTIGQGCEGSRKTMGIKNNSSSQSINCTIKLVRIKNGLRHDSVSLVRNPILPGKILSLGCYGCHDYFSDNICYLYTVESATYVAP